jgi:probable F420-dependent oxidoreductase
MEFGLQVMNHEPARLRAIAQMAEELGFRFLCLPDHLVYEGPEHQSDPHHPNFDPILSAAVMIEATKTAKVGHLVLCNLFRHPMLTARSLASLDHLSGGRVVAGLGGGWTETEFTMYGIPFPDAPTRLRMLDEALQVIRSLWTSEETTFRGEFYQLQGARLWPKPVQSPQPPILIGGGGKGLLRIAARHADVVNVIVETGRAGYIAMGEVAKLTDARFRERVRFLRDCAREAGRHPSAIRISNVCFTTMLTKSPAQTQERAAMFGALFGSPEAALASPSFLIGTPDEMVAEIRRRKQSWGVDQTIISFVNEDALRAFGEKVLPNV